jgi:hypothetical protein
MTRLICLLLRTRVPFVQGEALAFDFLISFLGLGPLAATLQADGQSGLPACCRRHGAHHCGMSMRMSEFSAQSASGGKPIFTTPATCPTFRGIQHFRRRQSLR